MPELQKVSAWIWWVFAGVLIISFIFFASSGGDGQPLSLNQETPEVPKAGVIRFAPGEQKKTLVLKPNAFSPQIEIPITARDCWMEISPNAGYRIKFLDGFEEEVPPGVAHWFGEHRGIFWLMGRQDGQVAEILIDEAAHQRNKLAPSVSSQTSPPALAAEPWRAHMVRVEPWPTNTPTPKELSGAVTTIPELKFGEWSEPFQKPPHAKIRIDMPDTAFEWWFSTGEVIRNPVNDPNSLGPIWPSLLFRVRTLGAGGKGTIYLYKK